MGRSYTPGLYTVTSWNGRAMRCEADERVVYRGSDRPEAVRVWEGLTRWKRRGIVEMTGPTGLVSTAVRAADPSRNWTTRAAG